ncbi:hypothetical protein [Roseburia inulinivorans]
MNYNQIKIIKNRILDNRLKIYTTVILSGIILTALLMYIRCFFGTEFSDEAYYVSEAKEMLNGNIPFAVNNSSKALGFTFLLIPIIFVHALFDSSLEGIVLITRLCFVTLKVVIVIVSYCILQKNLKKSSVLLIIGTLLPLNGYLQNFNYNSVPIWLLLLAGLLLFDAVEQNSKYKRAEVWSAGFVTAIALFANPGWGITLFIFLALLLVRIKDKREKAIEVLLFCSALMVEVLIVIVPIVIQTSFEEFWYGVYRLFINPIPVDSLAQHKEWEDVFLHFRNPFINRLTKMIIISTIVYIIVHKQRWLKKEKSTKRECLVLGLAFALLMDTICIIYAEQEINQFAMIAFAFTIYMFVFFFGGIYKEEKIILYLGFYPIAFVIAEIILVDYNATIQRFVNGITVLVPTLYILLKQKLKLTRCIATLLAGVLICSMDYTDYKYIYRDDVITNLDYKVESGVYKGIYTTEERSKDVIELEKYLNELIGKDETYSFRDNVPFAYLMTHKGKMCELSTWDYLQYTYHRNSPTPLYDYYRRRNMIPEWIVYIDYGRDEKMSIEDAEYKYNDWVNAYYDKIDDFAMNETFYHVIAYKYNGSFDGDYQRWINND